MRVPFGDFVVDVGARQLLRAGAVVHLSPKAFDLLVSLLEARPRVLSKADLHARIWPDVFVSDASLAMVVAEVRAALGESAREPRWVRTVHRHGYAFQESVREMAAPHAPVDCWLVTEKGEVPLVTGENVVGRDPRAQVWIDAPSVSRRHARLVVEPLRVTVEDLGSKNGTFVRGARIDAVTPLADGDEAKFGSVTATFRAWAAEPTRTEGGVC